MQTKQPVTFENRGGKLYGMLHIPEGGPKEGPGVVICHGYGGNRCGKHRLYVREAVRLAEAGIAALRFDLRGAGDSDGRFDEIDLEDEVSDILASIQFACEECSFDSKRIGLLGRSLGGTLAVLAASRHGGIKSLALWAPVFGADQWKEDWKAAQTDKKSRLLDDGLIAFDGQLTNRRFVEQFFALKMEDHLAKLDSTPLILFHGSQDTKVQTGHADRYEKARGSSKGESTFIMLPNCDHDFSDVIDQRRLLGDTCQWFKDTL